TRALTLFHLPSVTAFTIRAWSRRTVRQTFLQSMECQSGVRSGAAPAGISAADISAYLPESVGQGSLVTEHLREVSPLSGGGMLSVGGLTLDPIDYRAALACSLIPPPLSHQRSLQSVFPCGETTGFLRSPFRSFRGEVVPLGRWCTIHDGGIRSPRTCPLTFWFKPDSILGLSLVTAFTSTSPGLSCPGLLAPH